MSYIHLTISECSKTKTYLKLCYSIRAIAKRIHRSPSTISRELRRHQNCSIEDAQTHYQFNKLNWLKLSAELKEAIQEKLGETWSPEQIIGRLYQGKLSFKSVYCWIYNGLLEVPLFVLCQKGKCQKPRETRGRFNIGTPISKRPKEVRKQETFGHWELDTVVSGRGKQKAVLPLLSNTKHIGISVY